MNEQLGSKGGKQDRKRVKRNAQQKKKKQLQELEEIQKIEKERKKIRKRNIVLRNSAAKEKESQKVPSPKKREEIPKTLEDKKKEGIQQDSPILQKEIPKVSTTKQKIEKEISKKIMDISIDVSVSKPKRKIPQPEIEPTKTLKRDQEEKSSISKLPEILHENQEKKQPEKENQTKKEKKSKPNFPSTSKTEKKGNNSNKNIPVEPKTNLTKEEEKENDFSFLEAQILNIFDQTLADTKFELKKIDSDLYTIQKNIEAVQELEDLEILEKEIDSLMNILNHIKKQIESLLKTVDDKIPIDIPDNYLIYLVEEYKSKRKNEMDLAKQLQNQKEFQSVIDKIIQIESQKEFLLETLDKKKDNYNIQKEDMQKMDKEVVQLEDIEIKIENLVKKQETLLKDMERKVSETVSFHKKVDYISQYIDHSIFDVFILMNLLRRNLSMPSSAVTAVTTALIMEEILRLTTPTVEKKVTVVAKVTDYEKAINKCISDSSFLLDTMNSSLEQISAVRYLFLNEYK